MIVINIIGGPGAGKSTTAAGVFHKLKLAKVNTELVMEYAKALTWEKRYKTLGNQAYVFGKQLQGLHTLDGQVEVAVTDSPLAVGLLYVPADYPPSFKQFVIDIISRYDNMNYLLRRTKDYTPVGRNQTEEEARALDTRMLDILDSMGSKYTIVAGDETAVDTIFNDVMRRLGR